MKDEPIVSRAQALTEVRRILVNNLKLDREPAHIDPDVPLFGTGLGLDSVDAVELLVALETALGIRMPEETRAHIHLRTVNTVVDLVMAHAGRARAGVNALPTGLRPAEAGSSDEMRALREATAFSRHPELLVVRLEGADAFTTLDQLVPTDLYLREGQLRQSLLLDDDARPFADLYIGNDDGSFWLIAEGTAPDTLAASLGAAERRAYHEDHDMISIHGPWAWELVAALLGEDLVALPYLSFFHLDGGGVCFRGGKTGEFGYDLLLPKERTTTFVERLREVGAAFDLSEIGASTLAQARRETFFFDPAAWAGWDVTPHELQLRWRCSRRKDVDFRGARALRAREATHRASCLVSASPLEGDVYLREGRAVGQTVHAGWSPTLERYVGHALLERDVPDSDVEQLLVGGAEACLVSPPVLANQSLSVDPRRDRYSERQR